MDSIITWNQDIVNSINDIESEVNETTPDKYSFPNSIVNEILSILDFSAKNNNFNLIYENLNFLSLFNDTIKAQFSSFHSIRPHINSKKNQFLSIFASDKFIQMTKQVSWLTIFHMLPAYESNIQLNQYKQELFDKLSDSYSFFRLSCISQDLDSSLFIDIWSSTISADLLYFFVSSFPILRNKWIFNARLEQLICNLLTGFSSPDFNSFHQSVLKVLKSNPSLQIKYIPDVLGFIPHNDGKDHISRKLVLTLSQCRRCEKAWQERKNPMFQTSSHTMLVSNSLKTRGSSPPISARRYPVPQGCAQSSEINLVKAKVVIRKIDKLAYEHRKAHKSAVEHIFQTEEKANGALAKSATSQGMLVSKPLGFTFSSFQKTKTLRLSDVPKVDPYTKLSKEEVHKKRMEDSENRIKHIHEGYEKMWEIPRGLTKEQAVIYTMHEYFPEHTINVTKNKFFDE